MQNGRAVEEVMINRLTLRKALAEFLKQTGIIDGPDESSLPSNPENVEQNSTDRNTGPKLANLHERPFKRTQG